MKKIIEREIGVCDHCGSDNCVFDSCFKCGKDLCMDCRKTQGVMYNFAVHFRGDDGYYCLSCDSKLRESKGDPVHNAFVVIQLLRKESDSWHKDFRARSDRAEENLKILRGDV
ncbi:hypothetical protein LCGC14_1334740 [marine sediment metagenome]|uniref:Uncharacterized protein n=1 Tax=marine sediment metagenome TaxID=412755 RepID=A0A0F9L1K4_9ZZZZ|nr:hypothetical protein [Desulfobacterales bacterium]